MTHPRGGSEEFYSVQGAGYDPRVDSPWIGWPPGEVSNIVSLLVSTSLGSMLLWSVVFIWRCLLPVKTTEECVVGLYSNLSDNWEFGESAMWQNYSLNCYQFPRPTVILCSCPFTFSYH